MSNDNIAKISIIEGDSIETVGGSYTEYVGKTTYSSGQRLLVTAVNGKSFGDKPEDSPKVSGNAFIPIITPINDENDILKSYEVIVNDTSEWTFDDHIDENLRKQKSHEIKFTNNYNAARIKFKVEKGNSNANDDDGGNITILYFNDSETKSIMSTKQIDVKYGDTISVDWDGTKGIYQIQFYADDNDSFFDGGVSNVYCGVAKIKGSKVGRRLTKNIEKLPIALSGEHLPDNDEYNYGHPQKSIDIANKYQNCLGMCFVVSMSRVGKAYNDCKVTDAIQVAIKGDDYVYSGTITATIPDKYFGYGVGGALAKNGYAELLTHEDVWNGKLEEGAMIQYWNNRNEKDWHVLKNAIKLSIGKKRALWNVDFDAGHSVIFKSYIYDSSGTIIGIKYYDYVGIGRSFNESDKFTKLMQSANLKDEK